MKILRMSMLVTGLLLVSSNLVAHDDPFGDSSQKKSADPFADTSVVGDDPFAASDSEKASDPFAESSDVKIDKSVQLRPRSKRQSKEIDCNQVNDRIRETLSHCTTQTFDETPLIEAAREIGEAHDIRIVIDRGALERIGLSVEEPVTIALDNVSLRSFLRLMLHVHDLTYVIRDEVMIITSIESAEQELELRAYRLSSPLAGKSDDVVDAMITTVTPSAWEAQGGTASVATVLDNVMVVAGTETLHEKVQDFLNKIDAALEQQ